MQTSSYRFTSTDVQYMCQLRNRKIQHILNIPWRSKANCPTVSLSQEPRVGGPLPFPPDGRLTLKLDLPVPAVLLIHVCGKPDSPPDQVGVTMSPCQPPFHTWMRK